MGAYCERESRGTEHRHMAIYVVCMLLAWYASGRHAYVQYRPVLALATQSEHFLLQLTAWQA